MELLKQIGNTATLWKVWSSSPWQKWENERCKSSILFATSFIRLKIFSLRRPLHGKPCSSHSRPPTFLKWVPFIAADWAQSSDARKKKRSQFDERPCGRSETRFWSYEPPAVQHTRWQQVLPPRNRHRRRRHLRHYRPDEGDKHFEVPTGTYPGENATRREAPPFRT